jgi:hypothetical protein
MTHSSNPIVIEKLKTPGCPPDDVLCVPSVFQGPVVRTGYSLGDDTPLLSDGVMLVSSSSAAPPRGGGRYAMATLIVCFWMMIVCGMIHGSRSASLSLAMPCFFL